MAKRTASGGSSISRSTAGKQVLKKRASKRNIIILIAVTVVFAGVLLFGIAKTSSENKELKLSQAAVQTNLEDAEQKNEALQNEKGAGLTESRIIQIAREKFGLIFQNEIVFKPTEK